MGISPTVGPAPAAPSARRGAGGRRLSVDPFHGVVLISGIGFGLTAPFTALLVVSLGGSQTEAALTVASMGISLLFVDLFGSQIIPRLGSRWVLTGASLIFGIGSVLSATSSSWEAVMLARIQQGLGSALFMSGGVHLAVHLAQGRTKSATIGSFNAAWFAGIALAPLGGGLLASLLTGTAGLQLVFAVCAGFNLLAAALGWFAAPHVPSTAGLRPSLPRGLGVSGFRPRAVLVLAAVGQTVRVGVAMTLVPLIGDETGIGWTGVGVALFALAVTDVASMQWGTRWADTRGRRPLLVGGLVSGAALTALLAVLMVTRPPSLPVLIVIACGLGVCVGTTWTIPALMAVDLLPDPEQAVTAYRIACDLGMLLGGSLVSLAIALGGLSASLFGSAVALVAAALLTLAVGETRRPTGPALHQPEGGNIHALPID